MNFKESERQRNTLIKSESNEDEGIDICVLPEDLETKNGMIYENTYLNHHS